MGAFLSFALSTAIVFHIFKARYNARLGRRIGRIGLFLLGFGFADFAIGFFL
tara:strand:- start:1182 stop:1337 length:156 start_codon:yes stop_codon:yes gene_type:complete